MISTEGITVGNENPVVVGFDLRADVLPVDLDGEREIPVPSRVLPGGLHLARDGLAAIHGPAPGSCQGARGAWCMIPWKTLKKGEQGRF